MTKPPRYAKTWLPLDRNLEPEAIKLHNAMVERGFHVHMSHHGWEVDGIRLDLLVSQYCQVHRVWNRNEIRCGNWAIRWRHANETVIDSFEFIGWEEQMLTDLTYIKLSGYL